MVAMVVYTCRIGRGTWNFLWKILIRTLIVDKLAKLIPIEDDPADIRI